MSPRNVVPSSVARRGLSLDGFWGMPVWVPVWLAVLLLALAPCPAGAQTPAPSSTPQAGRVTPPPPRPLMVGQELLLRGCLRFTMENLSDRTADVEGDDWVTLRVGNECDSSRRHLLVEVYLFDPTGDYYSGSLWVLGEGEELGPGQVKRERYAIPDTRNMVPVAWYLRVLSVQRPLGTGERVKPAPAKPGSGQRRSGQSRSGQPRPGG